MRSAAAALTAFSAQFSGQVLAHPGAEGNFHAHFHGLGVEHALLFAVIAGVLAFAVRK
jgi:hypothetical protein